MGFSINLKNYTMKFHIFSKFSKMIFQIKNYSLIDFVINLKFLKNYTMKFHIFSKLRKILF